MCSLKIWGKLQFKVFQIILKASPVFLQPPDNGNDSKSRFSLDPVSKGVRCLKGAKSGVGVSAGFRTGGNRVAGVVTSGSEHLSSAGAADRGRGRRLGSSRRVGAGASADSNEYGPRESWAPKTGPGEKAVCVAESLPRPTGPARPHRERRGGLLTVQREEQQRRQRGAPTSHSGAAGSAPAARPAPRRGSGGAGRAL